MHQEIEHFLIVILHGHVQLFHYWSVTVCRQVGKAVRIDRIHNAEGNEAEITITMQVIQERQNKCVKSCNSTQNSV